MTLNENKKSEYKFYRQFKKALKNSGVKAFVDPLGRIRIHIDNNTDKNMCGFCPIALVYYTKHKKTMGTADFMTPARHLGMSISLSNYIAGAADESSSIIYKRVRTNLLRIAELT